MGASIFVGGFSTFLGVIPLVFSTSAILGTVNTAFGAMVLLGVSHGLVFLPVVLSIFGPTTRTRRRPKIEPSPNSISDTDNSNIHSIKSKGTDGSFSIQSTNIESPNEGDDVVLLPPPDFAFPSQMCSSPICGIEQQHEEIPPVASAETEASDASQNLMSKMGYTCFNLRQDLDLAAAKATMDIAKVLGYHYSAEVFTGVPQENSDAKLEGNQNKTEKEDDESLSTVAAISFDEQSGLPTI